MGRERQLVWGCDRFKQEKAKQHNAIEFPVVTGNTWKVKRLISRSFSGKLGSLTFRKCEFLQVLLEDGSGTVQQLVLIAF